MTIHRHSLSNSHLPQLSTVSSRTTMGRDNNNNSNNSSNSSHMQIPSSSGNTTRSQSTTSISSSLHSNVTTPEFSPNLIQFEVGDLLHLTDFELNDSNIVDDESDSGSCVDSDDDAASDVTELCDEVTEIFKQQRQTEKFFICLIGLPASGKSTVVKHLTQFLDDNFKTKLRCKSFNAGDVRRKHEKASQSNKLDFDFSNQNSKLLREQYALEALDDLTTALIEDQIDIGILDATNTTRHRRSTVFKKIESVASENNIKITPLILEVKCSNTSLRRFNIDKKANNSDYLKVPKDTALLDFFKRIEKYESVYEPVTVQEIQTLGAKYFCISNVGETYYYECGVNHHHPKTEINKNDNDVVNPKCSSASKISEPSVIKKQQNKHKQGNDCKLYRNPALAAIYEFLATYRTRFALEYLKSVESFYTLGGYRPLLSHLNSYSSISSTTSMNASHDSLLLDNATSELNKLNVSATTVKQLTSTPTTTTTTITTTATATAATTSMKDCSTSVDTDSVVSDASGAIKQLSTRFSLS